MKTWLRCLAAVATLLLALAGIAYEFEARLWQVAVSLDQSFEHKLKKHIQQHQHNQPGPAAVTQMPPVDGEKDLQQELEVERQRTAPAEVRMDRLSEQVATLNKRQAPPTASTGNQSNQWGIVIPFHHKQGSRRMKLAEATWQSLCRAMGAAKVLEGGAPTFNVMMIDDSGAIDAGYKRRNDGSGTIQTYTGRQGPEATASEAWVQTQRIKCEKSNKDVKLGTVVRLEGFHDISLNMQRGFRWASQYDYIVNIDSDLLLIPDFFVRMMAGELQSHSAPVSTHLYMSRHW